MKVWRFYWMVFKNAVSKFVDDNLFTHSAALSYYTIFSLPPIMLIVLYISRIFYYESKVKEALFSQFENLIGIEGATQLIQTIEKIQIIEPNVWSTALSIIILIFTSTTVFVTIQNALNKIFKIKPKPEGWGLVKMARDRVISFALIVGFAFILLVSLAIDAMIAVFGETLEHWIGAVSIVLSILTSIVLPFFIIMLVLATIFKFLPDAKLKWKDTWFGAILTSFLLGFGKYLIGFYIGNSNIANLYDTAGSIMVIMVWVFYASLIVMFGAVFTHTHIKMMGEIIPPSDYAVKIKKEEEDLELGIMIKK